MPGRVILVGAVFVVLGFLFQLGNKRVPDLGEAQSLVDLAIQMLQVVGFLVLFLGIGWLLITLRSRSK
jgi:hypothetical protein